MKIFEIVGPFNSERHLTPILTSASGINIQTINERVERLMSEFRSGRVTSHDALERLESLQDEVRDIFENSDYWDSYNAVVSDEEFEQMGNDWLSLEDQVDEYIDEIKGLK